MCIRTRLAIAATTFSLIPAWPAITYAQPLEAAGITAIKHFEVESYGGNMSHVQVNTPLATHRGFNDPNRAGDIYLTTINPQKQAVLYRFDTSGNLTSAIYQEVVNVDNAHHQPSLGIDQDGRVHLAIEQHNGHNGNRTENHFRQKVAGSMTGGFVNSSENGSNSNPHADYYYRYNLPGWRPSYANMQQLTDGTLAMTARTEVDRDSFAIRPGGTGMGVWTYQSTDSINEYDGYWDMHGEHVRRVPGADQDVRWNNNAVNTVAYTPYTARDEWDNTNDVDSDAYWYQSWRNSLSAGANGTMHVAFPVYDHRRWPYVSHVGYLMSDDGGQTFKKADGTVIDGPLTLKTAIDGPYNEVFDFVVRDYSRDTWYNGMLGTVHVSTLADGRPIVGTVSGEGGYNNTVFWPPNQTAYLHIFDPASGKWNEIIPLASEDRATFKNHNFIGLRDGSIAYVYGNAIYRSIDDGLSWESFDLPETDLGVEQIHFMWDRGYSLENDGVRFMLNTDVTGTTATTQVWTVNFDTVPEPGSLLLLAGSCGIMFCKRRRTHR
jgi:hypothetical protein